MELSKEPSSPLFLLGNHQIVKSIAIGNVGEFFLAYDIACRRYVAFWNVPMQPRMSGKKKPACNRPWRSSDAFMKRREDQWNIWGLIS